MKKNNKTERLYQREEEIRQMSHLIGAMAHQWKQPLNILGLLIQDIKDAYDYGEVNEAYLTNFVTNGMNNVRAISHSIDDFRSFFSPKFQSETIDIKSSLEEIIAMVSHQYQSHKITLVLSGESFEISAYLNSFRQAVMNIFGTIKDLFDELKTDEKKIEIMMDAKTRSIRITECCGILDPDLIQKILSTDTPSLIELGVYAPILNARDFLSDGADATFQAQRSGKQTTFIITFP